MSRAALLAMVGALACSRGPPPPSAVDTRNDGCASCRMLVSDPRTAAQLVARGEEPLFFDDVGCLAAYVRDHPPRPGTVAYVADHRTGAWVPANEASFVLQPQASTPMGSHVIAYRDPSSRDADPIAKGGRPLTFSEVLGTARQEAAR